MPKKPLVRDVVAIRSLEDLIPDIDNANEGSAFGLGMIERSLADYGAGRSIVVDRNGKIIGGNKTVEAAINAGLTDVVVVSTDGNKIIVHQRTDLDLDVDRDAVELAIADNRTSQVSMRWSPDVLDRLVDERGLRKDKFWSVAEFDELRGKKTKSERNLDPSEQNVPEQYLIIVTCSNEVEQVEMLTQLLEQGLDVKAITN